MRLRRLTRALLAAAALAAPALARAQAESADPAPPIEALSPSSRFT